MNDDTRLAEIDQMIDDITSTTRPGPPRSPDESLIRGLRSLTTIDWPSDDVGDRIAAGVARGLGRTEAVTTPAAPVDDRSLHSVWSRHRRGVVSLAAALIVLVSLTVAFKPWSPRNSTGPTPPAAVASLTMRLVDSTTSPFKFVGAGPQTGDLICVTATTCYADQTGGGTATGSGVERTTDGGVTWKSTAALPDEQEFTSPQLSCPTAEMCMGATMKEGPPVVGGSGPVTVAVSDDGGAGWNIKSVPVSAGLAQAAIDGLACSSPQHCVVHVVSDADIANPGGVFYRTDDGGDTWTAAQAVTSAADVRLFTLRCDGQGDCIGLGPTGSAQDPASEGIATVRSVDGGRTWTATSTPMALGPGVILMSCADAGHCLAAFPSADGGAITLATTADGGTFWKVTAAPTAWPGIAISVSCPTDLDCFVSAADTTASGGYNNPVIEVTHDGGSTWEPLLLPSVAGSPLALVFPLSCPVADGCIGVGATPQEFDMRATGPPAGGAVDGPGRVIISNLPVPKGR